ncbi:MAG: crossover junction endodeoxyribonuclease RuvC [Holosporales bacterium]|nr:crossover junction endodeoxyribonuclease RuvC [Holosporales bacterium]
MTSTDKKQTIIIGIDPGLNITGWGVIAMRSAGLTSIEHGIITTRTDIPFAERLNLLYQGLIKVLKRYTPDVAAVEKTFVNVNPTSALKLGMARGVVLLAPAQQKISVFEYAATQVKKTIVGVGHATKDQIAIMVQMLLPNAGVVRKDAADALAIAICHAHHQSTSYGRLATAAGSRR